MATEAVVAQPAGAHARPDAYVRPYIPSWIDRLTAAIERMPGPLWSTYLLLGIAAVTFFNIGAWSAGMVPIGVVDVTQSAFSLSLLGPLVLLHYLDGVAGRAWDTFRPVTDLSDEAADRIRYELTVMPARSGWAILIVGFALNTLWFAVDPVSTSMVGQPITVVAVRLVVEGCITALLLMLVYHSVRQLRIVGRLHRSVKRFDLLRPGPTNALSALTSRSAIMILSIALLLSLPLPGLSTTAWIQSVVIVGIPLVVLALVVFIIPLRGLHGRLVDEQERKLDAVAIRLESTTQALHRTIDRESGNESDPQASRAARSRIDALNKGLSSLLQERELVSHLSTWPWDAGTFRGMISAVVSAVLLPIGLWLLTNTLEPLFP